MDENLKSTEITGYNTSRDYTLLVKLMQTQSIVCIVDHQISEGWNPHRDICRTFFTPNESWGIGARGIAYIHVFSEEKFIKQCKNANVEFLIPNK